MKKTFLVLSCLLLAGSLFALEGEMVYVEGTVDLKHVNGEMEYADMGMRVETGDTVITGYDGYAELELEDGSAIRINEDSIFKLSTARSEKGTKNDFRLVLGSAAYKFTKAMKSDEPDISTPSTVCGLRGTSFSVMVGIDGTVLYLVDEGSITVSSRGKELLLGAREGLEILPGQVPGEPFKMLVGKIDHSAFKANSQAAFQADPAAAIMPLIGILSGYADDADEYEAVYLKHKELLSPLYQRRNKMEGEAKSKFYLEQVYPEEVITSFAKYNVRHFALSGLSLRRYVLTTMYVDTRTRYIQDNNNPVYLAFIDAHQQFLNVFEQRIVPYLVERDVK